MRSENCGPLQCCDGLTGDEDRIEFVLRNCQGWEGYYCTNMGNILNNVRHSQDWAEERLNTLERVQL